LTGFVLIVYVGVSKIFLLVGGLLILMATLYFAVLRRRFSLLALLLVPLGLGLLRGGGPIVTTLSNGTTAAVVTSVDSHYGNLKIIDYRYGVRHTREMALDGAIQSGIDMQTGQSIYPYYYLLGMIPYGINPDGKNCLVVGVGGGVIPMWYQARGIVTDAVDIDPEIFRLARDYFGYRANGGEFVEDARAYLGSTTKSYDYVVLDVFNGEADPAADDRTGGAGHQLSWPSQRGPVDDRVGRQNPARGFRPGRTLSELRPARGACPGQYQNHRL
jgi:hypothetical protein